MKHIRMKFQESFKEKNMNTSARAKHYRPHRKGGTKTRTHTVIEQIFAEEDANRWQEIPLVIAQKWQSELDIHFKRKQYNL